MRETYQTVRRGGGKPLTNARVLALTQVFEPPCIALPTPAQPGLPGNRRDASRMPIGRGHLTWVKQWLDKQAATRPKEVAK